MRKTVIFEGLTDYTIACDCLETYFGAWVDRCALFEVILHLMKNPEYSSDYIVQEVFRENNIIASGMRQEYRETKEVLISFINSVPNAFYKYGLDIVNSSFTAVEVTDKYIILSVEMNNVAA